MIHPNFDHSCAYGDGLVLNFIMFSNILPDYGYLIKEKQLLFFPKLLCYFAIYSCAG